MSKSEDQAIRIQKACYHALMHYKAYRKELTATCKLNAVQPGHVRKLIEQKL